MIVTIYFSIGGAHIIRKGNVPDLSQGLTLQTFMKVNGLLANVMISFHSHVVSIKVPIKIVGLRIIDKHFAQIKFVDIDRSSFSSFQLF